jgi:hypothetical protein
MSYCIAYAELKQEDRKKLPLKQLIASTKSDEAQKNTKRILILCVFQNIDLCRKKLVTENTQNGLPSIA